MKEIDVTWLVVFAVIGILIGMCIALYYNEKRNKAIKQFEEELKRRRQENE